MSRTDEATAMAIEELRQAPRPSHFASPLDFILREHMRQRTLCAMLDEIAADECGDPDKIRAVLDYLNSDFGMHVLDEEEDLFPLLRRRAAPENEIEDVLGELSAEHAGDRDKASQIVAGLSACLDKGKGAALPETLRTLMRTFASSERRHLIVENAIVMPLARAGLTKADKANLGRRMAARRGIDFPGATKC